MNTQSTTTPKKKAPATRPKNTPPPDDSNVPSYLRSTSASKSKLTTKTERKDLNLWSPTGHSRTEQRIIRETNAGEYSGDMQAVFKMQEREKSDGVWLPSGTVTPSSSRPGSRSTSQRSSRVSSRVSSRATSRSSSQAPSRDELTSPGKKSQPVDFSKLNEKLEKLADERNEKKKSLSRNNSGIPYPAGNKTPTKKIETKTRPKLSPKTKTVKTPTTTKYAPKGLTPKNTAKSPKTSTKSPSLPKSGIPKIGKTKTVIKRKLNEENQTQNSEAQTNATLKEENLTQNNNTEELQPSTDIETTEIEVGTESTTEDTEIQVDLALDEDKDSTKNIVETTQLEIEENQTEEIEIF